MEILAFPKQFRNFGGDENLEEVGNEAVIDGLSRRLTEELKSAKRAHLDCGEVLLPTDLTKVLARDMCSFADSEPYGLKGCTIFINFEDVQEIRRLAAINFDPSIPTTFELYLTLKQNANAWNNFIPQFLKKMTRGGTVVISSEYDLQKKKLYRSYDE